MNFSTFDTLPKFEEHLFGKSSKPNQKNTLRQTVTMRRVNTQMECSKIILL